jgi:hypothetical protein
MKRLNPQTGEPFKYGFVREDGCVFRNYKTDRQRKDGTFYENWCRLQVFQKHAKAGIARSKVITSSMQGRAKQLLRNCKRRHTDVGIDETWILDKLKQGTCELSGIKFDFSSHKKTHINPLSPSLDRINPIKGYTKRNTRVVLSAVNFALNQHGEATMLPILEAMVKGIKRKQNETKKV